MGVRRTELNKERCASFSNEVSAGRVAWERSCLLGCFD